MKRMIGLAMAAIGFAAFGAYEQIRLGDAPVAISGKAVVADVASADDAAEVRFKRIRNVKAYTNGYDIVSTTWTNRVNVLDHSNNTWSVTNVVYTKTETNSVMLLSVDKWVTNEIVRVVAGNGFATSNIVDGVWFVEGDFATADCGDEDRATLVIER